VINDFNAIMKNYWFSVLFLLLVPLHAKGQHRNQPAESGEINSVRIYFQVDPDYFSMDYIRKEIPILDYVRDPGDADIFIIGTSQSAVSGARKYSFYLIGRNVFEGESDTIDFTGKPDDIQSEIYSGQVNALKIALVPFLAKTALKDQLIINYTNTEKAETRDDPWNNWVIGLYAGGSLQGEKSRRYSNIWGGFSCERITEEWKFELTTDFGNQVEKFYLEDETVTSTNKARIGDALLVKSLSEHWSVGGQLFLASLSYSNFKLKSYLFPGIEYNIFPYAESARKQVRMMYSIGFAGHVYNDTTIYLKTEEFLWGHRLDIAAELIQEWGSLNAYLGWKNYLHDWSVNNLTFNASVNVRIAKGLQVRFSSGVSMVHNQLSLVKGGATREEILLRQVELETQYFYSTDVSLSYTFGSVYSGAVNPRFDDLTRW